MCFYICSNRYQTEDHTKYKMITREVFVILAIALGSASTFHCPVTEQSCTCQENYDGGIEINCLMKNDSSFLVNVQRGQFIKVCHYLVTSVLHLFRHSCRNLNGLLIKSILLLKIK